MKKRFLLLPALLLLLTASALALAACSKAIMTPEEMGYTVKIIYDANGGEFGDRKLRTQYAKPDSFLIAPGAEEGGFNNVQAPKRKGCYLEGWYLGTKDEDGNITYGDRWDFTSDRVSGNMTLYANWEYYPSFVVKYMKTVQNEDGTSSDVEVTQTYYLESGDTLEKIMDPKWSGHTFLGFYLDEELKTPAQFPLKHTGGNERREVFLYTKWLTGEYEMVTSADQLKYLSNTKNYWLLNDINFEGKTWMMPDRYSGIIEGNNHRIFNLSLDLKQSSDSFFGLFGTLRSTAVIKNLTIEADVNVTVGRTMPNGTFTGLLAGKIESGCKLENVRIKGSVTLNVDGLSTNLESHTVNEIAGFVEDGVDFSSCIYDIKKEKKEI